MKLRSLTVVAGLGAALALSGCSQVKKLVGGKPAGQVVATVNGEEITTLELKTELGNFSARDPAVVKAAQQQALQRIILRHVLAQAARKDRLDKSPNYTIQAARGEDTLLAQLYERKLATTVTIPAQQEAEAYVASHPAQFSNRRILVVDQLMAQANKIPADRFKDLHTLDQVKSLLDSQGVPSQNSMATIDTLSAPPQLIEAISKLPPGEVFVIPQSGGLLFNQISGQRVAPITGDPAVRYATNILRQQRAQDSVGKKIEALRAAAEKSIVYNPAFKPPPPAKAAAPSVKGDATATQTIGATPSAAPANVVPATKQ